MPNSFPKWLCHFTFLPSLWTPLFTSSPTFVVVKRFNFSYSGRSSVHCSLNLHFPDDKWGWTPFTFAYWPFTWLFFCTVFIHIFCPLFKTESFVFYYWFIVVMFKVYSGNKSFDRYMYWEYSVPAYAFAHSFS